MTAYSYSELARIYPDAGTGSSYFFAEAALLDKEGAHHRKWARVAKLSVGWISHLYYWIYPGIMVAFTGHPVRLHLHQPDQRQGPQLRGAGRGLRAVRR